jgi:hypothetical protein
MKAHLFTFSFEMAMKAFLKRTGLFLLSASLLYVLLMFLPFNFPNLLYLQGAYGHMNSRMKEVKTIGPVDVVFLGSSHAYRGFDPRIFASGGYSSFNLGSSNQTHIQTEVLLKRYLDQLNPRIVVYEVNPELFVMDGIESSLDLVANDQNDLYSIQMAFRQMHLKIWNSLALSFVRQITGHHSKFTEPDRKIQDQYIPGGYVEMDMKYYQHEKPPAYPIIIHPKQVRAFERNLDRLKKRHIQVYLVYAPTTKAQIASYSNLEEFEQWIDSKGNYLNFNRLINLNDTIHFADAEHLNRSGVGIFNSGLLKIFQDPDAIGGE